MKAVSAFAREILDMEDELAYLRGEVARLERYEGMYNDLLTSSINHSKQIIGGILSIATTPGVMDALAKNNEAMA